MGIRFSLTKTHNPDVLPREVDGPELRTIRNLRVLRTLGILGFAVGAAILIWGTVFGGVNTGAMQSLVKDIPFRDKGARFLIYGALTFTLSLVLQRPSFAFYGAIFLTGLGMVEEFRQRFVSGRTFEVADMAVNGIGAAVGLGAALAVLGVVRAKTSDNRTRHSLSYHPPTPRLDLT